MSVKLIQFNLVML